MVTIGAGGPLEANERAVALAAAHAPLFATVGVHPHEASIVSDSVLATIEALARRPKVVAIGETGLDYYYDNSPRPQQRAAFARFIELARALGAADRRPSARRRCRCRSRSWRRRARAMPAA